MTRRAVGDVEAAIKTTIMATTEIWKETTTKTWLANKKQCTGNSFEC